METVQEVSAGFKQGSDGIHLALYGGDSNEDTIAGELHWCYFFIHEACAERLLCAWSCLGKGQCCGCDEEGKAEHPRNVPGHPLTDSEDSDELPDARRRLSRS